MRVYASILNTSDLSRCAIVVLQLLLMSMVLQSCGGAASTISSAGTTPVLYSTEPAIASVGDTVVIVGAGFSVTDDNIVFVDGVAQIITDWSLHDNGGSADVQEEVSFVIPDGVAIGTDISILVLSDGNESNIIEIEIQ